MVTGGQYGGMGDVGSASKTGDRVSQDRPSGPAGQLREGIGPIECGVHGAGHDQSPLWPVVTGHQFGQAASIYRYSVRGQG